MEGEEGSQQPQLVLADKLFLLRQPDVQDIDKVRYKEDVFTHVKENDMVPLYETLVADSVLDMDRALLDSMRAKTEDELNKIDEKTEAKRASQMFGRIRASTSSLETLEGSPSKILKDDTFSIYEATLMKLKIGARLDTNEVIDDSSVSSPCTKEANQPDFNPESTSCSEKTMMDTESDNCSPRVSDIVSSGNSEQRRQVNLTILDFYRVVDTGNAGVSSSAKTTISTENGSSESISSTSAEYNCRSEVVGAQILQDCEMSD